MTDVLSETGTAFPSLAAGLTPGCLVRGAHPFSILCCPIMCLYVRVVKFV